MSSANGYRLKINSIVELSAWLDDYRTTSLRILGKQYGSLVARKAVELLDKDRMGIQDLPEDVLAAACSAVREELGKNADGIIAPDLNCVIRFHLVHDAVLATFIHGHSEYRKAWETNKAVVRWGWAEDAERGDLSEQIWKAREKYWSRANSRKLGGNLLFSLIEQPLPNIGWGAIWRYLPSEEERIAAGVNALKASDPSGLMRRYSASRLQEMVYRSIDREVSKTSFLKSGKNRQSGAKRLREDVTAARKAPVAKDLKEKLEAKERTPAKASEIDHADVIVASNNKIFVAVPYVGLDHESRVFVQVGDKHVAFSQNGVQYGFVDNVQRSSLDLLKTTNQVILVEIEKNYEERLLRAKHIAIVTDISLQESFGAALNRFHQLSADTAREKELKEWEKRLTTE